MKKKFLSAVLAAALLAVAGCAENIKPKSGEPKDTPVRVGEGVSNSTYDKDYTLEVAFESADIIADVTVVEWEGEHGDVATFFSVKANRIFKGEELETFTIMQSGSSLATENGYPLFKRGDRLLLFLVKEPAELDNQDRKQYKDKYWIAGADTTTMYIYEYEGEAYALGNSSATQFTEGFIKNDNAEKIDEELSAAIIADYDETDPVMAGASDFNGRVFNYGGIAEIIADMIETEES
jgi:opacity protein-like surface antigen